MSLNLDVDPLWIMPITFVALGALAHSSLERRQWVAFSLAVLAIVLVAAYFLMTFPSKG